MREYLVLKNLAYETHPGYRFQIGNLLSLANANPTILRNWFNQHYSANLMRLYILSDLSLEQLTELVVEDFAAIPNRHLTGIELKSPFLKKEHQAQEILIESKKADQLLSLVWELPSELTHHLDAKPEELISFFLNAENPHSLLTTLKNLGLVEALSASHLDLNTDTTLFQIEFSLSAKGYKEYPLVLEKTFQALKRLQTEPFPKNLYQEYAELQKLHYQYQEITPSLSWAMKQGEWLARESVATYPERSEVVTKYDPILIQKLANCLSPKKAFYLFTAPALLGKSDFNQLEPWMGIRYHIQDFQKDLIPRLEKVSLNEQITWAVPNRFLALNTPLAPLLNDKKNYPYLNDPILVIDEPSFCCYYAADPIYQTPYSFCRFKIQSPTIHEEQVLSSTLADFYTYLIEEQLSELTNEAKKADLHVNFSRGYQSIILTIDGFTESLVKFFPLLIEKLPFKQFSKENFQRVQEILVKEYDNFSQEMPIKQAFEQFKGIVLAKYTTYLEKKRIIQSIKIEQVEQFIDSFFKQNAIQGLVTGQVDQKQGLQLAQLLKNTFLPSYPFLPLPQLTEFKELKPYQVSQKTEAEGQACFLCLEADEFSPQAVNCNDLLSFSLHDLFFNELRTKQQTGYFVRSDHFDLSHHLFTYFAVESHSHSALELLWRFEYFLETYLQDLNAIISEERFSTLKSALLTQLTTAPKSFLKYSDQLFKLAFDLDDLNWKIKRLETLKNLEYNDFKQFIHLLLSRKNPRRLSILTTGKATQYQPLEFSQLNN